MIFNEDSRVCARSAANFGRILSAVVVITVHDCLQKSVAVCIDSNLISGRS